MNNDRTQPYIFSKSYDLALILAPAFVITLLVVLLRDHIQTITDMPVWLWVVLIMGVDVSHVYSTIFRTYLDKEELAQRTKLYVFTPLLAWLVGVGLYSINGMMFWRTLAYLAVFHFVRQQYGFMMIYGRGERDIPPYCRLIDKAAIYMATLYPLLYWHTHGRLFDWFVKGDIMMVSLPTLDQLGLTFYALVMLAYGVKETMQTWRVGLNLPKNLWLLGTALSWWVGIIVFNNDLAFTATNVIAHGIPYMALIWGYGRNQTMMEVSENKNSFVFSNISKIFQWRFALFYLLMLVVIAFIEEGVWDGLVWRDHEGVFALFSSLPYISDDKALRWIVPLLALPQATHYILDAVIWRMQIKNTPWKQFLFYQTSTAK